MDKKDKLHDGSNDEEMPDTGNDFVTPQEGNNDKKNKSYKNKGNVNEEQKKKGDGLKMATQIAATPIIYGEEARDIMKEAKTTRSERSKNNAKKLTDFFSKYLQKED